MNSVEILPLKKPVTATIEIPGSKSYTNRGLLLAALTKGEVKIINPLYSDDTEAMLSCLEGLGVYIEKTEDSILIRGNIHDVKDGFYKLNARLSGTNQCRPRSLQRTLKVSPFRAAHVSISRLTLRRERRHPHP